MANLDTDIAWAAGFLDGEGCFNLRKGAGEGLYYATIWATNTNLDALNKLREMFGGSIYQQKVYDTRHKPPFVWTNNGSNIEEIVTALLPYLMIKQQQARLLLKFRSLVGRRGQPVSEDNLNQRQLIYVALRLLNTRGAA